MDFKFVRSREYLSSVHSNLNANSASQAPSVYCKPHDGLYSESFLASSALDPRTFRLAESVASQHERSSVHGCMYAHPDRTATVLRRPSSIKLHHSIHTPCPSPREGLHGSKVPPRATAPSLCAIRSTNANIHFYLILFYFMIDARRRFRLRLPVMSGCSPASSTLGQKII